MAAEEENTELVNQQGQHGHGYGLELAHEKDLGSTKATLAKEIKRLQLHGEILREAISARDYLKLQRLTKNTTPDKLNLIESITEQTQELMIDNESSIQEVKAWNSETRGIFNNTPKVFENGNYILQQHKDEKAQSTKVKLQEEEQELKKLREKETNKFEEQIAKEKLATEKALWLGQRRIMLETKERAGNVEKG